jgi:uncharacterized protein YaiE (UPF0345 family)
MSECTNVTVIREANIYFNGAVVSHTVLFSDGSKKTLGVMQPGEYTFTTEAPELMEILTGELDLQLADEPGWRRIGGGQSFEVPGHTSFSMRVHTVSDYCCSFLP